MNNEMATEV